MFPQKEEVQNKSVDRKKKKKYCKNFKKRNNGLCKHCMECKVDIIVSCIRECEVGGIGEDRKNIKNTAT
ncbi:hypothetical protein JQS73_13645 [Clostridium botulinum]|uniref:Uncharacterized protein n=1 Tax=Clostridium botulinum TaxID=1491 RepID=A0ABD7CRA1_CLOBO|nr:hypothetical protein JQS73_13645 [Clostridium botulinum]